MNIKKQLTSISIISILCTGLALAPSSALAERHYSKDQKHSKSFSNQRSANSRSSKSHSSKSRSSNSRSHSKSNNRHNSRNNKHSPRYYEPRRQNRHYGHEHNSRRNYSVNYVYPWFLAQPYFNDGHFTIRYQDDNIGFTFRD